MGAVLFLAALVLGWASASAMEIPSTYSITDITGWSSNQLMSLPWFAHWIPVQPPGAPSGFSAAARNASGLVVGDWPGYYPTPSKGAFVKNGTNGFIPAWGGHNWSYWSCDATDCHYYWGRVEHSPATDVNALGQIAGHATIETPSTSSSLDFVDHAYLYDRITGWKTDLTPAGSGYARVYRLNDLGVVIGNYAAPSNDYAFRREADGTTNYFTHPVAAIQPMMLNNAGLVAGIHTTYTATNRIVVPWISSNTTVMTPIPLPPQGNPDTCTFTELNNHGLLVGWANKMATWYETSAARWYADPDGNWIGEDLNEVVGAGTYILDRVISANDAGHLIVAAHLDTASKPQRTLLLTPDVFPPPTVVTLPPANLTPTSAVLQAQVNPCALTTSASFAWGLSTTYHATNAASGGTLTGTLPVIVGCAITGLLPHTTYHAQIRAQNVQGTSVGQDLVFTTPYDYATWAAERFGAAATNEAVAGFDASPDGDSWNNYSEFALGLDPLVPDAGIPQLWEEQGRMTFTMTRPLNRGDAFLSFVAATNLFGPWISGTGATELIRWQREGNQEAMTIRANLPGAPSSQFIGILLEGTQP